MSIRTCDNCGWVFPSSYKKNTCKFCKHPFKIKLCSKCGKELTAATHKRPVCSQCEYIYYVAPSTERSYAAFAEEAYSNFLAWSDRIKKADYVPLTDADWLKTCDHFKGCSLCDKEIIEARIMFVGFEAGGRYTAWNMIPVCEDCAKRHRKITNKFKKGLYYTGKKHRDKIYAIYKYLQERLDAYEQTKRI